jgi:DNA polymerase-1
VLLDSHAIIHRAYHALPEFSNSKGEPTGALYGIATMLMKIVTDLKPDYIVATYDLPEKTFRHEAYDDYKAGRAKADDALVKQLVSSRKLFEAFGIPMYDKPGFEADDMLGTIVEQVSSSKFSSFTIKHNHCLWRYGYASACERQKGSSLYAQKRDQRHYSLR